MKNLTKPTESELEILKILWESGPSTVRFVNGKLAIKKEVGYTTTLKLMQIMSEKGLVSRNEEDRTHIYSAISQEKETKTLILDKMVDSIFGGSATKLVMQVLGNKKTTIEELRELREYLDKIEREQK